MTATTVNDIEQEERLLCYQLLWRYYRGELLKLTKAEWEMIAELLKNNTTFSENEWTIRAIKLFMNVDEEAIQTFEFDYNRLFIGPNRLLASPYESSYRNYEKTVMQGETLKVRNFYHHEGLQVAEEGLIPDDHLQFELEFICHLLLMSNEDPDKNEVLKLFLDKHLLVWCHQHYEQIVEHSQNPITLGMGYVLKALLDYEEKTIRGGKSYVK